LFLKFSHNGSACEGFFLALASLAFAQILFQFQNFLGQPSDGCIGSPGAHFSFERNVFIHAALQEGLHIPSILATRFQHENARAR